LLGFLPDTLSSAAWWYDVAWAHKFLGNWDKAFSLCREAAARVPRGEGDPAFWNLGIAATALREWAVARNAWIGFGVAMPEGGGEIVGRFGMCCVRPDTEGEREVVWAARLCPTRARVVSVPVTTGRRFGEVVLHDGEPKGERIVDGRGHSVFDELEAVFAARGYGAEPASSFQLIRACCSEGGQEQAPSIQAGTQQVSVAAPRG
jgi:hypothetical protein